ncbi:hypothetical protein DL98DRAFT_229521 [Cadophora sp. DSE1049]|nr:hypothetical protein DL98DRAFT_229521 [Cadophora sp. DSE1049]
MMADGHWSWTAAVQDMGLAWDHMWKPPRLWILSQVHSSLVSSQPDQSNPAIHLTAFAGSEVQSHAYRDPLKECGLAEAVAVAVAVANQIGVSRDANLGESATIDIRQKQENGGNFVELGSLDRTRQDKTRQDEMSPVEMGWMRRTKHNIAL